MNQGFSTVKRVRDINTANRKPAPLTQNSLKSNHNDAVVKNSSDACEKLKN